MTLSLAEAVVQGIGLYLGVGLVFSVIYVAFLAGRLDPAAKGMALRVRLLLVPGAMLLWPVMLIKTLQRKGPPVQ